MLSVSDLMVLLAKLEVATTIKEKRELLTKVAGDHEIKTYLRLVIDPRHNFYIKKLPEVTPVGPFMSITLGMVNQILMKISVQPYRKQLLTDTLEGTPPDVRYLIGLALSRKLPNNVGRKLLNQVWPGLIYEQPYGGCSSYDPDKIHTRFPWGDQSVVIQKKEDGLSLLVIHNGQYVCIYTRNGQDVTHAFLPLMSKVVGRIPSHTMLHFEGLLLYYDYQEIPRRQANGKFNALIKSGTKLPGYLKLVLLDFIQSTDGFKSDPTPLYERIHKGKKFVDELDQDPFVTHVETNYIDCLEDARRVTKHYISGGDEGAIIKDFMSGWESKRMTSQMKLKNEFKCTLRVTGYKPHKTKKGWVGSLLAFSVDGKIQTYVGSGLNETPGDELDRTQGYDAFDGSLIEVTAECITNKNRLQLPRVTHIRTDKDEADTVIEVQDAYKDSISLED